SHSDSIRSPVQINMVTRSPWGFIQRLVQADDNVIEAEIVSFGIATDDADGLIGGAEKRQATPARRIAGSVLRGHINVTADNRAGNRRVERHQFRFVCANGGCHAYGSDGCQTQCPFIKLHLCSSSLVCLCLSFTCDKRGETGSPPAPERCHC